MSNEKGEGNGLKPFRTKDKIRWLTAEKILIGAIWIVVVIWGVVVVEVVNRKINGESLLSPWNPWMKEERGSTQGSTRTIGFLPIWMIGKTQNYCQEITDLVFLGIEVDEKGNLIWDGQSRKLGDKRYLELKKNFKKCGGRNILGVKLFEDEKLTKMFGEENRWRNLIDQIKVVVDEAKYDGVNIDFEFQNDPGGVLEMSFLSFLDGLKKAGVGEISVDVFANTIIGEKKEELEELAKRVEYIFVMAYDFHRAGSNHAGPVSPMNAGGISGSLVKVVERAKDMGISGDKLVMGLPLYGYEWWTKDDSFESEAKDYVQMWKYLATEAKFGEGAEDKFTVSFDENSQSGRAVWIETVRKSRIERKKVGKRWKSVKVYYDDDEVHQVYFETEKSLKSKIELAKNAGWRGVGFWALGYEGKDVIKNVMSNK